MVVIGDTNLVQCCIWGIAMQFNAIKEPGLAVAKQYNLDTLDTNFLAIKLTVTKQYK